MIVKDLFLYLAAFLPKDALRGVFQIQQGHGYDALRLEVISLPDDRVIPELTDLVFGIDEESVRQRIDAVKGPYLFVEYGQCTSYINAYDVKTDKMHIGVTCAVSLPDDADQATQLLAQDRTLGIVASIRRQMRLDWDLGRQWLPMEASTLTPFRTKALANSFGWTLEWNTEMTDLI